MNNKINLEDKIVDGQLISPVLPEHIKNYMIDIDGTICDDIPNEEPERMATAESVSYTHLTLPTNTVV